MSTAEKLHQQFDYAEARTAAADAPGRSRPRCRKRRKRVPESLVVCLFAGIVVGIALLYLGQQLYIMQLDVNISRMESAYANVRSENQQLALSLKRAQSLAAVEEAARGRLGMVEPTQANFLVLAPDDSTMPGSGRWMADGDGDPQQFVFRAMSDWLGGWLPIGGVEAGRIED